MVKVRVFFRSSPLQPNSSAVFMLDIWLENLWEKDTVHRCKYAPK